MEDLCELLLYVGQAAPKSLEGLQLEEIMVFMVVFMGSPGYVNNPFSRSRIAEVPHNNSITNKNTHQQCIVVSILSWLF